MGVTQEQVARLIRTDLSLLIFPQVRLNVALTAEVYSEAYTLHQHASIPDFSLTDNSFTSCVVQLKPVHLRFTVLHGGT